MLTYTEIEHWLREHDRATYYALRTVQTMQPGASSVAEEILGFINHHYRGDPMADYIKRVKSLRCQQKEFERTGLYPANSYAQVKAINDEEYKLALLISFVVTHHRFEILQELKSFFREPFNGPERLLSIGYGTGYELKLARDAMPDVAIDAFDNCEQSYVYARELLSYYKCNPVNLKREYFPLERAEGLDRYRERYGKIVVCELLEHLEDPARALRQLRTALHQRGRIFLTMAVNIAQEDHVFLCKSPLQARDQVLESGYRIVRERLCPAVAIPFKESEREAIFKSGNYLCIAEKSDD